MMLRGAAHDLHVKMGTALNLRIALDFVGVDSVIQNCSVAVRRLVTVTGLWTVRDARRPLPPDLACDI